MIEAVPMRYLPLLALTVPLAIAQPAAIQSHTLDNGMKILIQEDHNIPNVAMYLFYRIGSRNERPGTTGLSHFFEHMMFNGARKYGPKQFDIQMEKAGGSNNAYTTADDTVYTDWFPSSALELMFDMEADRIRDLAIDPKIVESERGVVYSERRNSVDNNPQSALMEQVHAAAISAHPYHWPVIGWPSDIESWTMEDLRAHFKMGYAPNNCTMVVVGDVTSAQVMALAKKYIEPIPRQDPPPAIRTKEPEQLGERRLTLERPAQLASLMVAYHVPQTNHADRPVLDVIDEILTGGQSSRLYKRMVDGDQVALNVQAFAENHFDPGLWTFAVRPRAGADLAKVERTLFEELEKLTAGPVTDAELRKAKNGLQTRFYTGLQTIAGRANAIGNYELFHGGYENLMKAGEAFEAVTAADVQRVAKSYLKATNRTVGTLVPKREK